MASRISQSFSFHQSPESFIAERLRRLRLNEEGSETAYVIPAEILDRNVHIITSYRGCKAILCNSHATSKANDNGDGTSEMFAAGPAYERLMEAFLPRPNILLEDGSLHLQHKAAWRKLFHERVVEASTPLIREVTMEAFIKFSQDRRQDQRIDVYKAMKKLAWDFLFAIFLNLRRRDEPYTFEHIQQMQERILTGQFSLFPVSIRMPFWTSARSRGLKAVRSLTLAIEHRTRSGQEPAIEFDSAGRGCPFIQGTTADSTTLGEDEIVAHTRLFTSSIANKALASLLTAFTMNLFLWRDPTNADEEPSLDWLITAQNDPATRTRMLHSILKETERLSPPVIGIMRRAMQTVTHDPGHTIPAGHDAWLYFVAANRDPEVFRNPDTFQWDRFMDEADDGDEDGVTFGLGTKRCLGADLTHRICLVFGEMILNAGISFHGSVSEDGVKEWLGWQSNTDVNAMARDLKQLPCQRPRRPVMLTLRSRPSSK